MLDQPNIMLSAVMLAIRDRRGGDVSEAWTVLKDRMLQPEPPRSWGIPSHADAAKIEPLNREQWSRFEPPSQELANRDIAQYMRRDPLPGVGLIVPRSNDLLHTPRLHYYLNNPVGRPGIERICIDRNEFFAWLETLAPAPMTPPATAVDPQVAPAPNAVAGKRRNSARDTIQAMITGKMFKDGLPENIAEFVRDLQADWKLRPESKRPGAKFSEDEVIKMVRAAAAEARKQLKE